MALGAFGAFWKRVGSIFAAAFVALYKKAIGTEGVNKLAAAGKAVLASALGQIVLAVVEELNSVALSNDEKRREALARITNKAVEAGLEVKSSMINLAIEFAVATLKGVIPRPA